MLMISAHCSRAFPPMSNRSCSPMMNLRRDRWCARSRVGQTSTRSTSLRTDGRVRCRSAAGRCRWTRRMNMQPSSPKLGACCAVAQFTCGPARRRGVGAARPSSKRWRAPAARQSQLRRSASAGGGRWQLDARPGAIHASAPLTAQGVASYAGVMATQTITSGGPALSLSSTIFTDHPSPHAPYGRQKHGSAITSGGLTNGSTLALTGTVSDANGVSLVQVYDGATLLGTATLLPSISGVPEIDGNNVANWAFVTPALLDGSHSFTVTATDNAGNTTTTSAVTVMVDTTPPASLSVGSRETGDG